MNAIELKQVNFSYDGKTKILENTDFAAEYGEVTLLSGHSGEGKSTLMYIVSGIIPNVNYGELTGEVKIAGEDIKGKKLGYVCRKVGERRRANYTEGGRGRDRFRLRKPSLPARKHTKADRHCMPPIKTR